MSATAVAPALETAQGTAPAPADTIVPSTTLLVSPDRSVHRMEETRPRHGSTAGHAFHLKHKETPCDACAAAKARYDAARREQPEQVLRSRLAARAQSKAHRRLVKQFPELYRKFYLEEKSKLAEADR